MNPMQANLLRDVEKYLAERGVSPSTFGVRAVNSWRLVKNLRAQTSMTTNTLDRVRAYLDSEKKK